MILNMGEKLVCTKSINMPVLLGGEWEVISITSNSRFKASYKEGAVYNFVIGSNGVIKSSYGSVTLEKQQNDTEDFVPDYRDLKQEIEGYEMMIESLLDSSRSNNEELMILESKNKRLNFNIRFLTALLFVHAIYIISL